MANSSWADLQNQATQGGGALVPEGPYNAYVDESRSEHASSGKPMIVARFKIADGPYAGTSLYNNFVLSDDNPNALGYFFEQLGALGCDQAFFAACPPPASGGMEAIANRIMGQYAVVVVGHRTWQGKTRNQVNDVKPYGGAPAAAVPQVPQAPAPAPQVPQAPPAPQPQVPAAAAPQAPPAPAPAPPAPPGPGPAPQQPQQPQQPQAPAAPPTPF